MSDEIFWGPWVEHDHRGCPCKGEFVEVEHEWSDGTRKLVIHCVNGRHGWDGNEDDWLVIRYRVRRNPSTTAAVEALKAMAMARDPERVRENAVNEVTPYEPGNTRSNPRFVENEKVK